MMTSVRLIAGLLLVAPAVVGAQGSIHGCVTDNTGRALDGAWILVDTGQTERQVFVGADGCYDIRGLQAAAYRVRAFAPAFCDGRRDNVAVGDGQRVRVNFSLTLGPISEVIGINSWADALSIRDTAVHLRIEKRLDTRPWPSGGCASLISTEYLVRVLSVVQAPASAALAAGQLRVIRGHEWRERPDGPAAYELGDEFVAFLAWQPEPDRFAMPDPSWMVPVKGGLIEWKIPLRDGNPGGKTVKAFVKQLRGLAKR